MDHGSWTLDFGLWTLDWGLWWGKAKFHSSASLDELTSLFMAYGLLRIDTKVKDTDYASIRQKIHS